MASESLEIGDLVWAKLKGYPPWPAMIEEPPDASKTSTKIKYQYYVYFFGSKNYAWVPKGNVTPHSQKMIDAANLKKKNKPMQRAVQEICRLNKQRCKNTEDDCNNESEVLSDPMNLHSNPRTSTAIQPRKASSNNAIMGKMTVHCDAYTEFLEIFKKGEYFKQDLCFYYNTNPSPLTARPPVYEKKPSLPELDVKTICDSVKRKKVVPTKKKIGFIGLGVIGQGVVKSLLTTGHLVTVWNRTKERCVPFIDAGAAWSNSPADLVVLSDIIISCLKDEDAVKDVVFRQDGVLSGFDCSGVGKSYVEMTLISRSLAEELRAAVEARGGRYLNASYYGTKEMAENGNLSLTIAGDRDLYLEYESCFRAMCRAANYTGTELENTVNIAMTVLEGCICASLVELASIAKRVNVSQTDFMNLMKISLYKSQLKKDLYKSLLSQNFSPQISVSRVRNALELESRIRAEKLHPDIVGEAYRQLYTKAENYNYGEHDMSALYLMFDKCPKVKKIEEEDS